MAVWLTIKSDGQGLDEFHDLLKSYYGSRVSLKGKGNVLGARIRD